MTSKLVALQIRVAKGIEGRKDAGQGALEYSGMILVAALVAFGVWQALQNVDVQGMVSEAVNKILGNG